MTTFFTESFPSAGPAFGGDQSWTEVTGNWANAGSNTATVNLGSSVAWARCDTTAPSADMATTVTVNACGSGRTAGVAARMTNSGTLLLSLSFYAADFHFDTGTCYILKVVSGSTTVLTSVAFTAPSFPCDITMSVYGTSLAAYLNGTSIWSGTDTAVTAGSKAGLDAYNSSSDVVFANLRVTTAFQASATITSSDSGNLTEAATITVLSADSLTLAEASAVTVNITSADAAQMLAAPAGYGTGGYGEGLYGAGGYGTSGGTPLVVSIGVTPASPDSASLADSAALTNTLTSSDAAGFADTTTLGASFTSSDAATLAESPATITASVASSDAAGLVNSAAPTIGLAGPTDTGALAEALPAVTLTGPADAATLADPGLVVAAVTSTDAGTAADTGQVGALGLSSTDTATLAESATIAATLAALDGASAVDATSVVASPTSSDSGTLAETAAAAVIKTDTDSAAVTDLLTSLVAGVSGADLATVVVSGDGYGDGGYGGGDYGGTIPQISLTGADSATAVDVAVLSPSVSSTDAASLAEPSPTISVASADAGSLAESSAVTQLRTSSDAFTAVDATTLAPSVTGVDGAVLADTVTSLAATIAAVDAATLGETATISATLTSSDSAGLAELAIIGLSDTDSAGLAEATPAITVFGSDLHVIIDSLTSLTAAVADTDQASAVMTGDGYGEGGYGQDPYGGAAASITVTAAVPDGGSLAEALSSMSATVVGQELVSAAEQTPTIGTNSSDAASVADLTGLAVAALGTDGATFADLVTAMSATVTGSDRATAGDIAHINATVNGGSDLGALDDSDALARVITAILTGTDDAAGASGALGYGDNGYGDGPYGGTVAGAVLAGTPSAAVDLPGVDEPALILTGTPTI